MGQFDKNTITLVGAMYHHWWGPLHPWVKTRYKAVLGEYDCSDPAILDRHMSWLKQAGIDTLVLDFFITDDDWRWVERATDAVTAKCDQSGMKYFFLLDGLRKPEIRTPADVVRRTQDRAARYFARPGYRKVGGRPILFFWEGPPNAGPTFWPEVRAGLEAAAGPVYLTGDDDHFDRRMTYNPYLASAGSDPAKQLARQTSLWRGWVKRSKIPWAATCSAGYDDTRVRPEAHNPPIALNADYFRQSIDAALQYPQWVGSDRATERWIFVCSWNEWHEGSQIEPSSDFTAAPGAERFLTALKERVDQGQQDRMIPCVTYYKALYGL